MHLEGAVALDALGGGAQVLVRLEVRLDVRGDEEVRHDRVVAEVAQALEEGARRVHPARVEDHRDVLHVRRVPVARRVVALELRVGRQAAHQLAVRLVSGLHVTLHRLLLGRVPARLDLARVRLVRREALLVRARLRRLERLAVPPRLLGLRVRVRVRVRG